MIITKEELKELNKKGKCEFRTIVEGKEYWNTLEVEK